MQTYRNSIVEWRYLYDEKYEGKNMVAAWKDLITLDAILCNIAEEQLKKVPYYSENNIRGEVNSDAD